MIGCLRPIIALYFESETVLKFYNLKAWIQVKALLQLEMLLKYGHGPVVWCIISLTNSFVIYTLVVNQIQCNECQLFNDEM